MKVNFMTLLSTADYDPNFRPSLTDITTNGNLIIAGEVYSDDSGVTWTVFQDNDGGGAVTATAGVGIFVAGNIVYKITDGWGATNQGTYRVWTCDVSNNHIFTILDRGSGAANDLTVATSVTFGININADGDYLLTYQTGAELLNMFKYIDGTQTWTSQDTDAGPGTDAKGVVQRMYYDTTNQYIYALYFDDNAVAADVAATIIQYDTSGDSFDTDIALTDVPDASGFNFHIEGAGAVSKDHWVQLSDISYIISGAVYNGAVKQYDAVIKCTDITGDDGTGNSFSVSSQKRIVPIASATATRVWGFIQDSAEIYRSNDTGATFRLVTNTTGRTWEGLIEFSDSDFGFGAFDTVSTVGKFYTYQLGIGGSIKDVKTVLEVQEVSRAVMLANVDWVANQILEVYDDSDNLLFRGKNKGERSFGQLQTYVFLGLEAVALNAEVTLEYITATDVHTMAKAAIDYVNNYLTYTASTIPDPSLQYIGKFTKMPLRDVLDELADRIDGTWYVTPAGVVHLHAITGLVDSGLTVTQATGDIIPPVQYIIIQETFNQVHLYGRGYIESITRDEDSITENGLQELIRYYPGCSDQTTLDAMGVLILAGEGVATAPILIHFSLKGQGLLQAGEDMSFQFTHQSRLAVATTYPIRKTIHAFGERTYVELTNSFYQTGLKAQISLGFPTIIGVGTPGAHFG